VQEPSLIALHGARGAGKDTTFHFIQKWCAKSDPALSAVRRGFADKMKWAYMRMWVPDCTMEWAIEFIDLWKNNSQAYVEGRFGGGAADTFLYPVNFRDHMNQFATESAREVYGSDFWVDMLLPTQRYGPHDEEPAWWANFTIPPIWYGKQVRSVAHMAVITDLRAENEVARIKDLGGLCVKIKRRDAEEKERSYYEEKGIERHLFASELPDALMDVVISNNDNDMDEAYRRTAFLMNEIERNGIASIKAGSPNPWRIGL
jgi:hypothetical protein